MTLVTLSKNGIQVIVKLEKVQQLAHLAIGRGIVAWEKNARANSLLQRKPVWTNSLVIKNMLGLLVL